VTRTNRNLPDLVLPQEIIFTKEDDMICKDKDILIFAVPSVFMRSTVKRVKQYIGEDQLIVSVAKGFETSTLDTMSDIIEDEASVESDRVIALSGPTHAEEVAKDLPTTIVACCTNQENARKVQGIFENTCIRAYTNSDVKGVELCGALKNVIAISVGISTGLGYGDNARAALITRGMVEIKRLGLKMGCREETFDGLAGIGDLIVTATSMHSRNNRCGILIGKGYKVDDAVKEVGMVVEGLNALPGAVKLAEKYDVEMPIVNALNDIVNNDKSAKEVVFDLMNRETKGESLFHR
jgi:glycerol-3-phosphate dehydrogenase (NAD(P)+)